MSLGLKENCRFKEECPGVQCEEYECECLNCTTKCEWDSNICSKDGKYIGDE